jgi:DNA-binding PadR family transcriptional regulator
VLHAIEVAGQMDLPHLLRVLRPLGPMEQLAEALDRFVDEGWLDEGVDGPHQVKFYQLTSQGHERHAIIQARQLEVRGVAMSGIAADDYSAAVRVLERLVANLTPNQEARPPV